MYCAADHVRSELGATGRGGPSPQSVEQQAQDALEPPWGTLGAAEGRLTRRAPSCHCPPVSKRRQDRADAGKRPSDSMQPEPVAWVTKG